MLTLTRHHYRLIADNEDLVVFVFELETRIHSYVTGTASDFLFIFFIFFFCIFHTNNQVTRKQTHTYVRTKKEEEEEEKKRRKNKTKTKNYSSDYKRLAPCASTASRSTTGRTCRAT
jgi:uncharacterized membrane protein